MISAWCVSCVRQKGARGRAELEGFGESRGAIVTVFAKKKEP